MKIDLKETLLNLDGEADKEMFGKEMTLGKCLAKFFIQTSSQDSVQRREWALQLHSDGVIEVTPEQFGEIRKYVTELGASDGIKAPILAALNKQYEEQNRK